MRIRRGMVLTLVGGAVAATGLLAAHELAEARQRPIALTNFMFGFFDGQDRFVPTAGRGATNVDRNAVAMFVFSGAVEMGANTKATLPLTLAEQFEAEQDDSSGFEPGVIPRRTSPFRQARIVAGGSVNPSSVRIAKPTPGGGDTLADGVFFKVFKKGKRLYKNRFTFNPRFTAATFNRLSQIDYHPEGLDANTNYSIEIFGEQEVITNPDVELANVLQNLSGIPMTQSFRTTFETTDRYVQDFTRPGIRETSPSLGVSSVASDADVEISFSEPMDIDSFSLPSFQGDDQWTIRVNYSDAQINGQLADRNVIGVVRVKPQTAGNVIQFRPIQGYGPGPYEIEVTITAGVTDLSGNNIVRQQSFKFTTAFDPDAESFSTFEETFDTNLQHDLTFTPTGDFLRGTWDQNPTPDVLTTSIQLLSFIAQRSTNNSINVWFASQITFQNLYSQTQFGDRTRVISGFAFAHPANQPIVANTYPNTVVQIGHANDVVAASGFSAGSGPQFIHWRETPEVVQPGVNFTTTAPVSNYRAGPAWTKNFLYDGAHSVVMQASHNGHGGLTDERWAMDNLAPRNETAYNGTGATPLPNTAAGWALDTRFNYLSPGAESRSLWYDVGLSNARYLPQQLVPFTQPAGTSVTMLWQGAKGDVNNPAILDNNTITGLQSDIRTLANHRYLRFQITLNNNLITFEVPTVDLLTVPFTFR